MVGICVLFVWGLLGRRWGSAMGQICWRFLPPGPSWLLSVSSWKVTRPAAEGGVRLWLRVPTDPLDPRGGFRGSVSEGSVVRFPFPGSADRRGRAGVG